VVAQSRTKLVIVESPNFERFVGLRQRGRKRLDKTFPVVDRDNNRNQRAFERHFTSGLPISHCPFAQLPDSPEQKLALRKASDYSTSPRSYWSAETAPDEAFLCPYDTESQNGKSWLRSLEQRQRWRTVRFRRLSLSFTFTVTLFSAAPRCQRAWRP
jgi:hypothetical protein